MKNPRHVHTETMISRDARADWSDAFGLMPSIELAYVWHEDSRRLAPNRSSRRRRHSTATSMP